MSMPSGTPPVALTIAGSDPSGGAGIQADLKTFHQFGAFGTSAIVLLTVQNTRGVTGIEFLPPAFAAAQIDAVLSDLPVRAAKTGALGKAAIIDAVADRLREAAFPIVVDPVMLSKHGAPLVADDAIDAMIRALLPLATIVTPNLAEAERLSGVRIDRMDAMHDAARRIAAMGPRHVLIKAGHLSAADGRFAACDLLHSESGDEVFADERIDSTNTHGTGCVLSAAITALLARGMSVGEAVIEARRHVRAAIRTAPGLGSWRSGGRGPVNMHAIA
jgi:hydroxymethylpyrimidine/phosphomethylpyrimidine kinase